jgi:pimeloyl-ACP methyl ester carboxylesterase
MTARRRSVLGVIALVVVALCLQTACEYARGAALVVRAAGMHGVVGSIAELNSADFTIRDQTIASRHGPLRVRVYLPHGSIRETMMLVPGVHGEGFNEKRLVGFARTLATDRIAVVSPNLIDLAEYQVTPRTTDMIEDVAGWALRDATLGTGGRIAMMGISFGGGLAIVAGGRPSIKNRIAYVVSFGGYGDFARVLRYLCTGILPDGSRFPQHDYGVVIIMLSAAERLVPAEQVQPLRSAILTFLNASHITMTDKAAGDAEFKRARDLESTLPEPAATFMHWVNTRDVGAMGAKLLPFVSAMASDPALSPERSPSPSAPVFLLHGSDDNVVPASEAMLLASHLRRDTHVRLLITPLITHAEIDRPAPFIDMWRLISFWSEVLSE